MEFVSTAMDRGKRCQRPRRGRSRRPRSRRSSSTVRRKKCGANVSGRRRVSVKGMPAGANCGNEVGRVADDNGLGLPNGGHHEGDFVCDLLEVLPEPTANMILPPIPSLAE